MDSETREAFARMDSKFDELKSAMYDVRERVISVESQGFVTKVDCMCVQEVLREERRRPWGIAKVAAIQAFVAAVVIAIWEWFRRRG